MKLARILGQQVRRLIEAPAPSTEQSGPANDVDPQTLGSSAVAKKNRQAADARPVRLTIETPDTSNITVSTTGCSMSLELQTTHHATDQASNETIHTPMNFDRG